MQVRTADNQLWADMNAEMMQHADHAPSEMGFGFRVLGLGFRVQGLGV